jgi:hypothetical protein
MKYSLKHNVRHYFSEVEFISITFAVVQTELLPKSRREVSDG